MGRGGRRLYRNPDHGPTHRRNKLDRYGLCAGHRFMPRHHPDYGPLDRPYRHAVRHNFLFHRIRHSFLRLFMPFVGSIPSSEHILLFIAVGAIGSAGQFCITSAFKNTQASIVTIFNYSGIIWATSIGWIIWGDWPTLAIWIGGSIVIGSNLFIIYREQKRNKADVR